MRQLSRLPRHLTRLWWKARLHLRWRHPRLAHLSRLRRHAWLTHKSRLLRWSLHLWWPHLPLLRRCLLASDLLLSR